MACRLGNREVYPASTEGPENVFSQKQFTLAKRRWMKDDEVHVCPLCNHKFNHIRRRHHCRQCGKIIELGGVQTLIYMSQSINDPIKASVANAIHTLATHTVLHEVLVKCGAIKAICSLLTSADASQEQTLIDGVSALMLFCKSTEFKAQAVSDGALQPVLSLCGMKEHIALLAVMTLSLIVEHQANLAALVEDGKGTLQKIMNLTLAKDEKMQEIALKILASLSLGTEWQRHRIVQEYYVSNKCFVEVIRRQPKNHQVLVNAACLIGNLATCEQDQSSLRDCLEAVCTLLNTHPQYKDIQIQVSRAIGKLKLGFYKGRACNFIQILNGGIRVVQRSDIQEVRTHAIRSVFHLLCHAKEETLTCLRRNGMEELLLAIVSVNGMPDAVQGVLLQNVKERSKPMSL
eukprot:gene17750-19524_t